MQVRYGNSKNHSYFETKLSAIFTIIFFLGIDFLSFADYIID